jgi:hypothetical protein
MADRKELFSKYDWPGWARTNPRYMRLTELDLFLEGKAYDHLPYSFNKEEKENGDMISIYDRRPSVTYNIPGMVARITSRKLFAGRHAPTLYHKNPKFLEKIKRLVKEAKLGALMPFIVRAGSVGSACLTFKVVGKEAKARLKCEVWAARWCQPTFDLFGDLHKLRIAYPAPGAQFIESGYLFDNKDKKIDITQRYWRVFDLDRMTEVNYQPMLENTFNPVDPGTWDQLVEDKKYRIEHNLGIVQAYWFQNLAGGVGYDGACTWEDAIQLTITSDYELSQLNRGVNYNAAPQIVTIGKMLKFAGDAGTSRSPAIILPFAAPQREMDGSTIGGGDAKLLEMQGDGIKVGLELAKCLRKLALEQIGAGRKDPDEVNGIITGKAMELLDEDFIDLTSELKTAYGENGYIEVVKLQATVAIAAKHPIMAGEDPKEVDGLSLVWPRIYDPTPQEVMQLVQGMSQAVGGTNSAGQSSPQIVKPDDATALLYAQIDFPSNSENRNEHDESIQTGATELPDKDPDNINPPLAS